MTENNYLNENLPPDLKNRIIHHLKSNNMITQNQFPKFTMAIVALSLVATFALGFTAKSFIGNKNDSTLAESAKSKYMLLLSNTPEFVDDPNNVGEYIAWANDLGKRGILVGGEELTNEGTLLGNSINKELASISGYFMIEAKNDADAKAIAMECPHLKHKGEVMVKKVIMH